MRGSVDFARATTGAGELAATLAGAVRGGPDDGVWLAADARLDNRPELLATLGLAAAADDSPTDAELILAAWLRWGEGTPERLLGDFAFAVWEARARRLVCVRDGLGIKPLHYARPGSLLVVAATAEQVLEHPAVPCRLDETAVARYLGSPTDDPERSFFADVHPLPPGSLLVATAGGCVVRRWWEPARAAGTAARPAGDDAEALRELLGRAVADRLRGADAAAGISLSGGLDSGSVAALARRALAGRSGAPALVASSCVFARLKRCDERGYLRALAAELDLELEEVAAERRWFLGHPQALRPALETPFQGWEWAFGELLGRLARRGVRVLLTGQAGDELLGGSRLVYADRLLRGDLTAVREIARYAAAHPGMRRRILYLYFGQPLLPRWADGTLRRLRGLPTDALPSWISPAFARRTGLAERARRRPAPGRMARAAIYASTVGDPAYRRAVGWYDRVAAPYGIEVRHPFLDRRLVEFVLALPPDRLFRAGGWKPLLREAMAGILPEIVRRRPDKASFSSFVDLALREREAARVEALLTDPLVVELGFVEGERLQASYRRYRDGALAEEHLMLWYVVTLEIWLRHHSARLGLAGTGRQALRPAA